MAQVALGLLRMKAAALLVGLTGVGLIGLFNNLILTGGAIGGLGVASAATREIAAERSRDGEKGEFLARRALVSATLILSIVATALTWLFRRPIAQLALGDPTYAAAVGWLSIAVGLTVIASSQTALLAGLRRMGRMAQTYVAGGVIATIAAIASLFLFHSGAIVFFVIALPLANVLAGAWFVARLPRPASTRIRARATVAAMASVHDAGPRHHARPIACQWCPARCARPDHPTVGLAGAGPLSGRLDYLGNLSRRGAAGDGGRLLSKAVGSHP